MADRSVLDPQLLELVETLDEGAEAEAQAEPVDVLIAVRAEARDQAVSEMQALGLNVGTVAGDIVSGRVDPASLVAISELPDVVKMELGSPLLPEESPPIDYTE